MVAAIDGVDQDIRQWDGARTNGGSCPYNDLTDQTPSEAKNRCNCCAGGKRAPGNGRLHIAFLGLAAVTCQLVAFSTGGLGAVGQGFGMLVPSEERPTTVRQVGRRLWLETLNGVAEYGGLVIFSGLAVAIELTRRAMQLPTAANVGIIVSEVLAAWTLIVPKAVRTLGDFLQVVAITGHDVVYSFRHGEKRPPGKANDHT